MPNTQALAGFLCSRLFAKMDSRSHVTSGGVKSGAYGRIRMIFRWLPHFLVSSLRKMSICKFAWRGEPGTSAIISKYTCGMSDFPMPDSMACSICFGTHVTYRSLEYPHYLSQAEFQEYMESYATHFDMHKDIVFNASVKQVYRNKNDSKWRLEFMVDGELRAKEYEKVVFCHGYVSSFSILLTIKSVHFINTYIRFTDIRRKQICQNLRASRNLRVQWCIRNSSECEWVRTAEPRCRLIISGPMSLMGKGSSW